MTETIDKQESVITFQEPPPMTDDTLQLISSDQDPFHLSKAKKNENELQQLRKRGSKGRQLVQFYKEYVVKSHGPRQNDLIESLLTPPGQVDADEEKRLFKLKIAIYGSAAANFFLVALQLTAAIASGSLAILATAADAFMDMASSIVILVSTRAAASGNIHTYPTGKARVETAGIIVFSVLMATVSIQVMIEAAKTLSAGEKKVDLDKLSIICIGVALGMDSLDAFI